MPCLTLFSSYNGLEQFYRKMQVGEVISRTYLQTEFDIPCWTLYSKRFQSMMKCL